MSSTTPHRLPHVKRIRLDPQSAAKAFRSLVNAMKNALWVFKDMIDKGEISTVTQHEEINQKINFLHARYTEALIAYQDIFDNMAAYSYDEICRKLDDYLCRLAEDVLFADVDATTDFILSAKRKTCRGVSGIKEDINSLARICVIFDIEVYQNDLISIFNQSNRSIHNAVSIPQRELYAYNYYALVYTAKLVKDRKIAPLDSQSDSTPLDSQSDSTPLDSHSDSTPLDSQSDSTPLDSQSDSTPLDHQSGDTPPRADDMTANPLNLSEVDLMAYTLENTTLSKTNYL